MQTSMQRHGFPWILLAILLLTAALAAPTLVQERSVGDQLIHGSSSVAVSSPPPTHEPDGCLYEGLSNFVDFVDAVAQPGNGNVLIWEDWTPHSQTFIRADGDVHWARQAAGDHFHFRRLSAREFSQIVGRLRGTVDNDMLPLGTYHELFYEGNGLERVSRADLPRKLGYDPDQIRVSGSRCD